MNENIEGFLLIDKPKGPTSFNIVARLRRILKVEKIGHAGTLDPMATGLLILLVGRKYTRLSDQFLTSEKSYLATATLGFSTDSFDAEGETTATSPHIPTLEEVMTVIHSFQGGYAQIPPMFSAKKIGGKKLYELAREGKTLERAPVSVSLTIKEVEYCYPELRFHVTCSKGTYIRSLVDDIGRTLGSFATLTELRRLTSGTWSIDGAFSGDRLFIETTSASDLIPYINLL